MTPLKGQTAWITGGRRIGRTVASMLAERGVNLVLSYRHSAAEAVETAERARRLGVEAITVAADVAVRESFAAAVEQVRAVFPRIDILINMASLYRQAPIDAVTERDWADNFGAHVLGSFWPAQLLVPLMPRGGHIINVADSRALGRPQRCNTPYVVTKAAVAALTRQMALEYGERGIFVNALAPGPVLPPEDFPAEVWQRIRERCPVQYPMTDEEAVEQFALLVLYLCVTTMSSGHVYPLDLGENLR